MLGAAILMGGIWSVATMDAVAKLLSEHVSVWQITWARFFFHSLLLTPLALFLWRRRPALLTDGAPRQRERWGIHIMRGLLLALSSAAFFLAIRDNPVPDSLAVFFVEPLLVMIIARVFLGEAFNRRLLAAALVGLIGVLIILRPGGDSGYNWTILFSLVAAFSFAGYIVSARFASFHTPAPITSWLTALFGLAPTLPALFFWEDLPGAREWALMVAVGALSGLGHTLIILALAYARAAVIAVLHYSEVVVAAFISWLLFSHLPGFWVWVGIACIAAANLFALRGGGKRA